MPRATVLFECVGACMRYTDLRGLAQKDKYPKSQSYKMTAQDDAHPSPQNPRSPNPGLAISLSVSKMPS